MSAATSSASGRARRGERHSDLVVCGELVLSGYPPEDLVLKRAFQERIEAAVGALAADTADGGPALLVGAPWRDDGKLYNAALLLDGGRIAAMRFKHDLPNYGVFDEKRVFAPARCRGRCAFRGAAARRHGLRGHVDAGRRWPPGRERRRAAARAQRLALRDTTSGTCASALPRARVAETGLPLIYVNQVGGQDELVFDGASFVLDAEGAAGARPGLAGGADAHALAARGGRDWTCAPAAIARERATALDAIYQAMMLGLRDYVEKNRFPGVCSACPAASTARSPPRSPSTRWGRSGCAA